MKVEDYPTPESDPLPQWVSLEAKDIIYRAYENAVEENRTVAIQVIARDLQYAVDTYGPDVYDLLHPSPRLTFWQRIRRWARNV